MNARQVGIIGGMAGLLFVVGEMLRQAFEGRPPVDGTAAQIIAYGAAHPEINGLFPWLDAVAAAGFLMFGLILIERQATNGTGWLLRIATAGVTLTFGVSLVLDGLLSAFGRTAAAAVSDGAPTLFAAVIGIESLFAYTLAAFLVGIGAAMVANSSRVAGWTAVVLGVAFLVSELLSGLGIEVELEAPLFIALLVWIAALSVSMIWRRTEMTAAAPVLRPAG